MSVTNKHTMVPEQATVIKVFDPINKQPYELVFGGPNTEVFPTAGLAAYYDHLGGNKRVFLCKKYQQRQCRAQARCNSIHACRQRICELREDLGAQEVQPHPLEEATVQVWSEADNEQMVVPISKVHATAGFPNETGYGILCSAYESRTCSSGVLCPHAHIDISFTRAQRALWKVACCSDPECPHSNNRVLDPFPTLPDGTEWQYFRLGAGKQLVPRTLVAVTRGLRRLVACEAAGDGVVRIPPGRVCRPHQKRECKWGADCNNVHLCRVRVPASSSRPKVVLTTVGSNSSESSGRARQPSTPSAEDSGSTTPVPTTPPSPTLNEGVSDLSCLGAFQGLALPAGGINLFS